MSAIGLDILVLMWVYVHQPATESSVDASFSAEPLVAGLKVNVHSIVIEVARSFFKLSFLMLAYTEGAEKWYEGASLALTQNEGASSALAQHTIIRSRLERATLARFKSVVVRSVGQIHGMGTTDQLRFTRPLSFVCQILLVSQKSVIVQIRFVSQVYRPRGPYIKLRCTG